MTFEKKIKVLHISAHLGGGVGRVLSNVFRWRRQNSSQITERFICIEPPQDLKYTQDLVNAGADIIVSPDCQLVDELILWADIVQVEWWHHPLMPGFLCNISPIRTRLVFWSHISGLFYPFIPEKLIRYPNIFLFSSPASVSNIRHNGGRENRTALVQSSGGFDDFPLLNRKKQSGRLRCGYLGTYAFAKLHPDIVKFIETADSVDFSLECHGEIASADALLRQISRSPVCQNRIKINGYTDNPATFFNRIDILIYLLNPQHYGTTENALLEAMACGVVPIVLNNPVECSIIKNMETGFIVETAEEFADVLSFCRANPERLAEMGQSCASDIRQRFSIEQTENQLKEQYTMLMHGTMETYDFSTLFGSTPEQWFSFALGEYAEYFTSDYVKNLRYKDKRLACPIFYEQTKSSVRHFYHYYPDNKQLTDWVKLINTDRHPFAGSKVNE